MSIQHMQTVFDAGDLTAPQKAVLLAYCNFTDPHGYCWPGVERIADMTGLSVSGVKKVRKQLLEAKLMTTVSRGKKGGGRKTNGSRINVKRLQKMKLPPREYDDNLMPELGFEEDEEPDEVEAKVPEGHTNGSPEVPQRYPGGTNVGTCGGPYPSVDPSGDPSVNPSSSSAEVEDVTHDVVPTVPKKKTSKSQNREQAKTLIAQRLPDSTNTEQDAIIDLVYAEAATKGTKIGFITSYIGGRPDSLLEQDLAQVRRYASAPPSGALCSEHDLTLALGKCASCEGDMNTGDFEVVRKILERDGAAARPDLARRIGAPQVSAGRSGGHVPFRNPVDQSVYDDDLCVPSAPTDFSGDF